VLRQYALGEEALRTAHIIHNNVKGQSPPPLALWLWRGDVPAWGRDGTSRYMRAEEKQNVHRQHTHMYVHVHVLIYYVAWQRGSAHTLALKAIAGDLRPRRGLLLAF
jgi:hypothetical protein